VFSLVRALLRVLTRLVRFGPPGESLHMRVPLPLPSPTHVARGGQFFTHRCAFVCFPSDKQHHTMLHHRRIGSPPRAVTPPPPSLHSQEDRKFLSLSCEGTSQVTVQVSCDVPLSLHHNHILFPLLVLLSDRFPHHILSGGCRVSPTPLRPSTRPYAPHRGGTSSLVLLMTRPHTPPHP